MTSNRSRLDRFISSVALIKRADVRLLVAQKRVYVNGVPATTASELIDKFTHISLDGSVLQERRALYVMLHKPVGVISATKDCHQSTVLDLLAPEERKGLHLAGRLDLNSSGLVLLTNDGAWSRTLSSPENKIEKVYQVTVEKPLSGDYVQAFKDGVYFGYEDITTQPVTMKILNEYSAELRLTEGRYHQIKRMFGRFRNPVLSIHRISIGSIVLDSQLAPSESRALTHDETRSIAL